MRVLILAAFCTAGLAACAVPPPDAFVGGGAARTGGVGLGRNTAGEACTQQVAANGADIFCGTWDQPSGHVTTQAATSEDLRTLATASPWRNALDTRLVCGEPAASSVLGAPALVLSCTRKVGGWPQAALVTRIDNRVFLADGIVPAAPVMERSVAVLSGRAAPEAAPSLPPGQSAALVASRLAAQSFGAGDIGQFQQLMTAGTRANLAENYTTAERAFRAAYALQRKALGAADPNTAVPLMLVALQLSNQGRTAEAATDFDAATRLAARTSDPTALPRLQHYRALNALNAGNPGEALPLLQAAERGYTGLLPPDLLQLRPPRASGPVVSSRRLGGAQFDDNPVLEPEQQAALVGVVETRRYQAIALRGLDRPDEARAAGRSAAQLAESRGLRQRDLTARLARTGSLVDEAGQAGAGDAGMRTASRDFSQAQPGTRPVAQTLLLRAAAALRANDAGDAVTLCREASALLQEIKAGTDPALMEPCLAAFAAEGARRPAERQPLLRDMFAASQLVQGGITVRQIALASARLTEGAKDNRVGDAIRRQQDAGLLAADLQSRVDAAANGAPTRGGPNGALGADDLAKQLAAAQAALADADAALQAASPNYGQLVQQVVASGEVLKALAPGEALASLFLGKDGGWVFVLRGDTVEAVRTDLGAGAVTGLVRRIRHTVELADGANEPPAFDSTAAQALYAGTLGPAAPLLQGVDALVVVPTGALLSLPFELMLTGPAAASDLAHAPWLMQRFAITHVPAAANFVTLRRTAGASRATQPWFGFGDFKPVTLAQARATFPAGACQDSAQLFAGLPPLPFAARELTAARLLTGAPVQSALLGPAFTKPRVLGADLRPFRVLHFATHALLPTDLRCQTEPAIVTSGIPGAPDARAALLGASDIAGMQLDADVVILSACNSGGPNGATSGESLSGLARAFFYAGARALMVTHWSVNDTATALLVAGTLQRLREGGSQGRDLGLAGAFQASQKAMLADAGTKLPAAIAHPFYWAPFALVGEGRGRTTGARTAGL